MRIYSHPPHPPKKKKPKIKPSRYEDERTLPKVVIKLYTDHRQNLFNDMGSNHTTFFFFF